MFEGQAPLLATASRTSFAISLGFWFSVTILTPLVLLVALFTQRKQLLHDLVLGTAAVRTAF